MGKLCALRAVVAAPFFSILLAIGVAVLSTAAAAAPSSPRPGADVSYPPYAMVPAGPGDPADPHEAWQAVNREQGLRTFFAESGTRFQPDGVSGAAAWQLA